VTIPGCDRYLQLLPHIHDTDGFFAAVMQRRVSADVPEPAGQ
jgi:16S rRNA C967 or C1407 C5-methylase (RsmB/RsmF family)